MRTAVLCILTILFFTLPSLHGQNGDVRAEEAIPEVEFSLPGGFYDGYVDVELVAHAAEVFYTLDGKKPNRKSLPYRGPIRIDHTSVLRAVAYRGGDRGNTLGHTYFIDEPRHGLPVVSVAVPDWVLFDQERGLFMQGSQANDSIWTKPGANFWSNKEVLINTEIFETDGHCVFRSESGLRLFGGISRLFPQKSLVIVARKRYGERRIEHPVFGPDGLDEFKFLVLRNSGSDWGKSHFRDGLMTSLMQDSDLDLQDYRPTHLYLNGRYWGIYNIREKINKYFLNDHHEDIDKDSIDLLEHAHTVRQGSRRNYYELLTYLRNHDLSDPAAYAYVVNQIDLGNFMDHQIAQIFFDNRDAGGNVKFWRPHLPNARWRWILFDTDWGFGLHDKEAYRSDAFAFHTEPNGPDWPNPPWSTFLLRKMLENPDFRQAFVNRFADHLNYTLRPERVERFIDEILADIGPEMPRQLRRWRLSESIWNEHVERIREFGQKRSAYVWDQLSEYFDPGSRKRLVASSSGGGALVLNGNLEIRNRSIEADYFSGIPLEIKAIPDYGYRFSHWEGIQADSDLRVLHFRLSREETRIRAVFEPYNHPLAGKVIINEVSPNNKESGDWLEIFNHSRERVYLKDWILTDSKNEFVFPDASIGSGDYLVLCEDPERFRNAFPRAYNVLGGMDFGLNKRRETIRLFANRNAAVDSLSYELPPVDSVFTLSLLLPGLNNSDPENWLMRFGEGSPNAANPYYVQSSIRMRQSQWIQVGAAAGVILLCLILLFFRARGMI